MYFDGNYKKKRPVNLNRSSRGNRQRNGASFSGPFGGAGGSGPNDILSAARASRKQSRRDREIRDATVAIQKHVRGWRHRRIAWKNFFEDFLDGRGSSESSTLAATKREINAASFLLRHAVDEEKFWNVFATFRRRHGSQDGALIGGHVLRRMTAPPPSSDPAPSRMELSFTLQFLHSVVDCPPHRTPPAWIPSLLSLLFLFVSRDEEFVEEAREVLAMLPRASDGDFRALHVVLSSRSLRRIGVRHPHAKLMELEYAFEAVKDIENCSTSSTDFVNVHVVDNLLGLWEDGARNNVGEAEAGHKYILLRLLLELLRKERRWRTDVQRAAVGGVLSSATMLPFRNEDEDSYCDTDHGERIQAKLSAPTRSRADDFRTAGAIDSALMKIRRKAWEENTGKSRDGWESEKFGRLSQKLLDPTFIISLLPQIFSHLPTFYDFLATILSHASSLRPPQDVTFLSAVAFRLPNNTMGAFLWKDLLARSDLAGLQKNQLGVIDENRWCLFCNVYSHRLLATGSDDDEYCNENDFHPAKIAIKLRDILYRLYWTEPLLFSSLERANANTGADLVAFRRASLMCATTKAWNALYERWCRKPFCAEDAWYFPRGGAVSVNGGNPSIIHNVASTSPAVVSMDDDGDDSDMDEDLPSTSSSNAIQQGKEEEMLAKSFRDPKMARLLTSVPQAVPFDERVAMFQSLIASDKSLHSSDSLELPSRNHIRIERADLYHQAYTKLNHLGSALRNKIQITFINHQGLEEAGIDGGGVFKEFMDDLVKEAFSPEMHYFSVAPGVETLKVNVYNKTMINRRQEILAEFEFLGRILGKACYESILIEPQFSIPFLKKLLGKQNSVFDLRAFDPEFYRHLTQLKKHPNIEDMGLTFEIHSCVDGRGNFLGQERSVELCPGGSSVQVTKDNCIHYVHLIAHHRLNAEGSLETQAFLKGFQDIIPAAWVRLFSAVELQKLLSGDSSVLGIDVKGLREVMVYSAGYHISQPIIGWFWEVLSEMNPSQQQKFLRFMTSCSRQPLLGFRALVPCPCIQQVPLTDENGVVKLPSSGTCMNLLKLPKYLSKEIMREKLIYAIENGTGFELS